MKGSIVAETEERKNQDIGQDEAYIVNLKEVIASEKDVAGRSRIYFDALAAQVVQQNANLTATISSINSSIALAAQKQVENVLGVNATDFAERDIINSPWAEAMKTLMTQVMTEIAKKD